MLSHTNIEHPSKIDAENRKPRIKKENSQRQAAIDLMRILVAFERPFYIRFVLVVAWDFVLKHRDRRLTSVTFNPITGIIMVCRSSYLPPVSNPAEARSKRSDSHCKLGSHPRKFKESSRIRTTTPAQY